MSTFTMKTRDVAGACVPFMALGATVTTGVQLLAAIFSHMAKLLTFKTLTRSFYVFIN